MAKQIKPFHLLLCMLAFHGLSSSLPSQAAQSDFFYLTLVWPGSHCSGGRSCCMPTIGTPALDFFVESMETYDSYTGQMVSNCNSTSTCKFYVNILRNFIDDMYTYWPDVSCPRNNGASMWKSTFCKYGPCSNLTQAQYFKNALTLRQDLDLLVLLGTKGIVPSNSALYDLEDIESALRSKYPFSFVVECHKARWWFGRDQIHKIRYCISMDGKKFISCPISRETNCADKVLFPIFTYDMLADGLSMENGMGNPIEMSTNRDDAM